MKLRKHIKIRFQGIILIVLAYLCTKTDAGGAAVMLALIGAVMLFHSENSRRTITYRIAKKITDAAEKENAA